MGRLVRPPAPTEMTPQELTKYDGTQDTPEGYAVPPIYVGIKNKVKPLFMLVNISNESALNNFEL